VGLAPIGVCPKKIYKSSRETLEKKGLFASGRMVEIPVEVSEEEHNKHVERQLKMLSKASIKRGKELSILSGDDGNTKPHKPRKKRTSTKQVPMFED
jgi:hypothetical protein